MPTPIAASTHQLGVKDPLYANRSICWRGRDTVSVRPNSLPQRVYCHSPRWQTLWCAGPKPRLEIHPVLEGPLLA